MYQRIPVAYLLILFLMAAACSSTEDESPRVIVIVVGPEGGTFEAPDDVTLIVPPGSLSENTELTITTSDDTVPGLQPESVMVTMEPKTVAYNLPVQLVIPYKDPTLPQPEDLMVFWSTDPRTPATGWTAEESVVDVAKRKVKGKVTRNGAFFVARPLASDTDTLTDPDTATEIADTATLTDPDTDTVTAPTDTDTLTDPDTDTFTAPVDTDTLTDPDTATEIADTATLTDPDTDTATAPVDTETLTDPDTDTATAPVDTDTLTDPDTDTATAPVDTDTVLVTDCVVRVNAGLADYAGHDGSDWALALESLQEGIDAAVTLAADNIDICPEVQIWVAGGTYIPSVDVTGNPNPVNASDKTFLLPAGTQIYGGFAGSELTLLERVFGDNTTVLSGAVDADVAATHVVTGASDVILDRLTITGGYANDANQTTYGNHGGGLLLPAASDNVVIRNCTFQDNNAASRGGAVHVDSSAGVLFDACTFAYNVAGGNGGAVQISTSTDVNIWDCYFEANSGLNGGAFQYLGTTGEVTGSEFYSNTAINNGGAAYFATSSQAAVANSIFFGNSAGWGDAVFTYQNSNVSIVNTVVYGHRHAASRYIMESRINCIVNVVNSIFWNNDSTFLDDGTSVTTVTYSNIEMADTQAVYNNDQTNINAAPMFADEANGDFHLMGNDPGIDMGLDDAAAPWTTDFDGATRIVGAAVDMGPYEYQ